MNEWISVKDKLPECSGLYMVKAEVWRHGKRLDDVTESREFDGEFFDLSYAEYEGIEYRKVTHWQDKQ